MNKLFSVICILLLPVFGLASERNRETINEGWYFHQGNLPNAELQSIDLSMWQQVNIPHCWNSIDSYKTKDYYRGIGWYRREIKLSEKHAGKQLFIRFEGASLQADVYINGKFVGNHKGGYTAFCFDVTEFLNIDGNNIIAVKVDNSEQDIAPLSADFTFFGGMYRDVWLITTNKIHFDMENMASSGIFIETPQVSEAEATVLVRGAIQNKSHENKKIKITNNILDINGKVVSTETINLSANKNMGTPFSLSTKPIKSPNLWSPEQPYLYTVETCILDAKSNSIIDKLTQPLGFRWFRFDANTGFHVNGKPYKLNGVCRHQDQQFLGSALSDEQHRRDMQLIKEMGANFIRISHYPQDDAILEQCDRLGFIAWEEIPVVNYIAPNETFASICESQLREMIRQHYNHPSVVMWGYMNEIMLGTLKKSEEPGYNFLKEQTTILTKRLEKVVHDEDKARSSVTAQHENLPAYDDLGLSEIPDVLGWNLYQGWYTEAVHDFGRFMDNQHKLHPERSHIISEYGAGSDIRIHSLQPEIFDFSIEYQQYYTEEMLKMINERKYIAGSSLWNFIDFGSAVREESMPHINNKGITYADRTPKDIYYYYKAMWNNEPMLHIASRDWQNRTGMKLNADDSSVLQPLKVYSNLSEAELFMNGKSVGKRSFDNCNVVWNAPFIDGLNTIIARGTKDGKIVEDVLSINFKSQPVNLSRLEVGFELGVNVGSTSYFTDDQSNFTWIPEKPYEKGSWGYRDGEIVRSNPLRLGIQSEVGGTHNQPLFQTMRQGLKEFRFDVPDGRYEVELSFADPKAKTQVLYDLGATKGKDDDARIFDVLINNETMLKSFDLQSSYGSLFAVTKRFIITTSNNNGVQIKFSAIKGEPILNGVKIRKL